MVVVRALNRGFSLAEILLVMAITASMAALAVPVLAERDVVGSEVRRVLADGLRVRARARAGWEASVLRIEPARDLRDLSREAPRLGNRLTQVEKHLGPLTSHERIHVDARVLADA